PDILIFLLLLSCSLHHRPLHSFPTRRSSDLCYAIPLHWLISIHFTRFVGVYFLILYRHGMLPFEFGVVGGIGDVVIAFGAVILRSEERRVGKECRSWWGLYHGKKIVMIRCV